MQQVRLGFHLFRERPTNEAPSPEDKACIVTAKNLDGTARLVVFEPNGSQFTLDQAELVQASETPAHYEEYFAPQQPLSEPE